MANSKYKKEVEQQLKRYRELSPKDLGKQLLPARKEQFALRLQRATGQAVKPDQFGKVRRNIARIKTVLGAASGQRPGQGQGK
jgi:large subunit ribosomal protein L29